MLSLRPALLGAGLLSLALAAPARADLPGGTEIIDVDAMPPDEGAPSVDVFLDVLRPYGSWVVDARWGRVWAPRDRGYRPYFHGYWQATTFGFAWIPEEPFGWVVSHYGRWFWDGRWLWRPDNVWAPAWVMWRQAEGYLGWAPLPPEPGLLVVETQWIFVPVRQILRVDLARAYAGVNPVWVYRASRPLDRYVRTRRGDRYVAGPDPGRLHTSYDVSVYVGPLLPRITGRFQGDAWRDPRALERRRRDEMDTERRRRDEQRRWQLSEQRRWSEQDQLRQRNEAQERRDAQRRFYEDVRRDRQQVDQQRREQREEQRRLQREEQQRRRPTIILPPSASRERPGTRR